MNIQKFKLPLLLLLFSTKTLIVKSQESIVPRVSGEYVDKLVRVAQKNYPEVTARSQQTAIAKNKITQTQVSWLDAFNVSYFYRPNRTVDIVDPNLFNGYQLGVSLNLGSLFQKPFATKEAKLEYKVAQLQERQYNLTITALVKERYFAYLEQMGQLRLRTKSYTDAEALVKQLRYKFEKGEAQFDDYQRALILSAEQNQQLIHAEAGVFTTKSALEELLGDKLENVK
ncbi:MULTISPECIES: TolC family protein [unclassified Mucilaginibacter]|uniref:TolC family protein n=1 Tax=unclassified Mucilaginibacter TaxID=2617802 RepID=UPI0031F6DEA8